jgi:hypothetical protein
MTLLCSVPPPQTALYNHSQLQDLKLKNLAIYPSDFTTTASSDTTIYWANVNFQEFGVTNQRVWQFNVSGITNQDSTTISFVIATPYNIKFEKPLSGWFTTSSNKNAINAYNVMKISSTSNSDYTTFNIYIKQDEPLQTFSFDIFQRDDCVEECTTSLCSGTLVCLFGCCAEKY